MEARFIGPEAELGPVHSLNFFGQQLTREWSDVKLSPEQLEKAKGNKYVEIRGADGKASVTAEQAIEDTREEQTEDATRARLAELGVDVPENASPTKLRSMLDKAEKAAAQAEAEAQAAAEKLAGEDTSSAT